MNKQTKSFEIIEKKENWLPGLYTGLVAISFFISVVLIALRVTGTYSFGDPGLFHIDGLTLIMWLAVSFFSLIVYMYSRKYMAGYKNYTDFFTTCFGFTMSVMLMVAANHMILFVGFWFLMGLNMAHLIGHVRDWQEAQYAAQYSRVRFMTSSFLVLIGAGILSWQTGALQINAILLQLSAVPDLWVIISAGSFIIAAAIQSSLFPFHKWLLSAMTAPTPASALMHAGFVNAAGILLARFAPTFYASEVLWIIVLLGGFNALFGKYMKQVQSNVKRKLACSTIAQMGFMVLQCGLGYFNAAIAHLILHGCFKAYLFLTSGSQVVKEPVQQKANRKPPWSMSVWMLLAAVLGGGLFALITGKGLTVDSGLFLVFIVVLSVMFTAQEVMLRPGLHWKYKAIVPVLIVISIVTYGLIFNGITILMSDVLYAYQPVELNIAHYIIGSGFLISYIGADRFRKSRWLYMTLVNSSQPISKTIFSTNR